MCEEVVFKGSRDGLQLVFIEPIEFEAVIEQLKTKLESAVNFFTQGTIVQMSSDARLFTPDQHLELTNLFANYGLMLQEATAEQQNGGQQKQQEVEEFQTLVITKTLRGGQEITHTGSVIVMGDVNPGAKLTAGGNIVIHGTCRGIVHAGLFGNMQATITADKLLAAQIRIADLIARAPDHLDKPECVETARIQDGIVVIGPANK